MSVEAQTDQQIIRTCEQMRLVTLAAQSAGKRVGVVMTMGALHQGHLSLVEACKKECEHTVVSIFVNPTQFGPHEDLEKYPREWDDDRDKLTDLAVDAIFLPNEQEMYPPGSSTEVSPPSVARKLEGLCRPGHFKGVVTIVLKLLHAIPANVAFFGQKDYQQYLVIQQMAKDLKVPTEIRVCPTIREPDGLALSSRNRYLSDDGRRRAIAISQCLDLAEELAARGAKVGVIAAGMRRLLAQSGIRKIDYVAVVDAQTLEDVQEIDRPTLVAIAAFVDDTRLIDNRTIQPAE